MEREKRSKLEGFLVKSAEPLIRSKIGYPLIGMLCGEKQEELAREYNINRWSFSISHIALCLSLAAIPVGASYIARYADGNENLWLKIASYGGLGNLVKTFAITSVRSGIMFYRRRPVGDLAYEGVSSIFQFITSGE